ncbi:MAG: UDP-N-acetylmuramate dehydrogenase [Acidobacteriota bacterium]|nr:UDP-N-acetylmuramate dehydrogenase [Acidobacteriota bacterium]
MPVKYLEKVPLAPFTTFRVGGVARLFVEARTEADIESVFSENKAANIFVLGGGSNVLISDKGFDGIVLKIATSGVEIGNVGPDKAVVTAAAGEDWDELVESCVSGGLAGIECLSGIPGLVGGTPIQNVGAYGQEVSESIVSVRALEKDSLKILDFDNADCGFEYRTSVFNGSEKDRYVVLSVTYALTPGGEPKIEYADLKRRFEGTRPGLRAVREGVKEIRASKGMLVRQGGPDSQSAGSFFKNPIIGLDGIERIGEALGMSADEVPSYGLGKDRFKVPAAWLIERAGFSKGYRLGNAGISTLHSLALTNQGGASAVEIISLKEQIEESVESKFGIALINEPSLIGFNGSEQLLDGTGED